MKYAVHNGQAIYGVGESPTEAWKDAVIWAGSDPEGLVLLECSDELYAQVKADGGAIDYLEENGSLRTIAEAKVA